MQNLTQKTKNFSTKTGPSGPVLRLPKTSFCQPKQVFRTFLNIMMKWYLRDLSRKQRTAIRVRGEFGKPAANCAVFGYMKDPSDKYRWLID